MNKKLKEKEAQEVTSTQPGINAGEIIIGWVKKVDHTGVYVDFPQNLAGTALLAMSTIPVAEKNVGREVALLFNGGDIGKPVVMGMIHSEMLDSFDNHATGEDEQWLNEPLPQSESNEPSQTSEMEVVTDGKHQVIEAQEELTLKCGKSSITLRKDGKILLRGTYLSSRSSGTNRILGGSVLLN